MPKFRPRPRQYRGKAFVTKDNIDTDQIIPAEYLTLVPSKVCVQLLLVCWDGFWLNVLLLYCRLMSTRSLDLTRCAASPTACTPPATVGAIMSQRFP